MTPVTRALATATAAVRGKSDEQRAKGLFNAAALAAASAHTGRRDARPGGDFEVLAYLAVLPPDHRDAEANHAGGEAAA